MSENIELLDEQVDDQVDFFISYDVQDQEWANWLSWQIEHMGFSVHAEVASINTSMDYIALAKDAARRARHMIVLFSPYYLTPELSPEVFNSLFPDGNFAGDGELIPIRVQDCFVDDFVNSYVDFVGRDEVECITALKQVLSPLKEGRDINFDDLDSDTESDLDSDDFSSPDVELVGSDGSVVQLRSVDDSDSYDDIPSNLATNEEDSEFSSDTDIHADTNISEDSDLSQDPYTYVSDQATDISEDPNQKLIELATELRNTEDSLDDIGQPIAESMSVDIASSNDVVFDTFDMDSNDAENDDFENEAENADFEDEAENEHFENNEAENNKTENYESELKSFSEIDDSDLEALSLAPTDVLAESDIDSDMDRQLDQALDQSLSDELADDSADQKLDDQLNETLAEELDNEIAEDIDPEEISAPVETSEMLTEDIISEPVETEPVELEKDPVDALEHIEAASRENLLASENDLATQDILSLDDVDTSDIDDVLTSSSTVNFDFDDDDDDIELVSGLDENVDINDVLVTDDHDDDADHDDDDDDDEFNLNSGSDLLKALKDGAADTQMSDDSISFDDDDDDLFSDENDLLSDAALPPLESMDDAEVSESDDRTVDDWGNSRLVSESLFDDDDDDDLDLDEDVATLNQDASDELDLDNADLGVDESEFFEPPVIQYAECMWNIKMARLSNFVGREHELVDLQNRLFDDRGENASMIAISGFPGVGKTQLILEYCLRNESNYQLIWWIDASSVRNVNRAFFELLSVLEPNVSPYDKPESIREKVFAHLRNKNHWLIVMDDVADLSFATELFPKLSNGHVLFSSLHHHWPETILSFHLNPFSMDVAHDYLSRRVRYSDRENAQKLINELGALPLALSQSASYISRNQISLVHYHQLLLNHRARLWERELPVENYGRTVYQRYAELLEAIDENNPVLIQFLQFCALLHHVNIPLALFSSAAHVFPSDLASVFKDDIAFSDFLFPLLNNSLIVRNEDFISVAPLLKFVVLDRIDPSAKASLIVGMLKCLDEVFVYDYFSRNRWALCVALDHHIDRLVSLAEVSKLSVVEMPRLLNRLGLLKSQQGYYSASKKYLDWATSLLRPLQPPDEKLALDIKINLGLTNGYMQEFDLAEGQLKSALESQISHYGNENETVAKILHSFGVVYRLKRDNVNAQSYLERSIEQREKLFGPDDPRVAASLENLGVVLFDIGNIEAAESNFNWARKIYNKSLPEDHPDVAYCLSNVAVIHQIKGSTQEAYDLFKKSLDIFDRSSNQGHPNAILARKNFARFYESEGDYDMAETLYKGLLPIVEDRYGPGTYELAKVFMDLARVTMELDKLETAKGYVEDAQLIVVKEFGAEHVNNGHLFRLVSDIEFKEDKLDASIRDLKRAISLFEKKFDVHKRLIAELYQDLGLLQTEDFDHNSARFAFEQSLAILSEMYTGLNVDKAYSQFFLAKSLTALGDYDEALSNLMDCLSQFEELFGEDSLEVALINNGVGVIHMKRYSYNEAISYFQRSGRVRLQKLGSDNVRTANSLNNIAMCKYLSGEHYQASTYFDKVLQVYQNHYGKDHQQIGACYNNLGLVLLDQNKLREALPNFEKAYKIYVTSFGEDDYRTSVAGYNYALCLTNIGEVEEAKAIAEKILGFFMINNGQGSRFVTQTLELQDKIEAMLA